MADSENKARWREPTPEEKLAQMSVVERLIHFAEEMGRAFEREDINSALTFADHVTALKAQIEHQLALTPRNTCFDEPS